MNSCDRLGLGVGLDLPWGQAIGFEVHDNGDQVSSRVRSFLKRYGNQFEYLFFAFQPRDRQPLDIARYSAAYDDLFDAAAMIPLRALHQTTLNMGCLSPYNRSGVAHFTNQIIQRYDIRWVVEDVGIWSMRGKVMPYPIAPVLNDESLRKCVDNVCESRKLLTAPLCIEFPGFTDGSNFFIGRSHAYDFFYELAERSDVSVTLDVGHLLSYQWMLGKRGGQLYGDLERLPLERCHEIHLSGCSIVNDRFRDLHHGILLDEQIELLQHLLLRCPHAKAVTYEDPKFGSDGKLVPKSVRNFERLEKIVSNWKDSFSDTTQ